MLAAVLRIEKASISQFLNRWIKCYWIKLALNIGRGCTEFCVNGLMAGNRRTSWREDDRKFKESSTQRSHR